MNRLPGTVLAVERSGSITLVDVQAGLHRCTATMVGAEQPWSVGMPVNLLFKDTEVSLGKHLSGLISMRNRLPGTITAIETGRLLSRVVLDVDGAVVAAVITSGSCARLALAVGDQVEALIKANEMSLQAGTAA
jgi:molybdate transport system regulatory protein